MLCPALLRPSTVQLLASDEGQVPLQMPYLDLATLTGRHVDFICVDLAGDSACLVTDDVHSELPLH